MLWSEMTKQESCSVAFPQFVFVREKRQEWNARAVCSQAVLQRILRQTLLSEGRTKASRWEMVNGQPAP